MAEKPTAAEIKEAAGALKHTEIVHDASKPALEPGTGAHKFDKSALLESIEKGVPLKHCETVDKGAPAIDPDAHIGQNRHREVMEDAVAAAKQRLQQQQGAA